MNNKHTLAAFSFVWLVALTMVSGTANALTPDGETPANEGVCDAVQGASPGLYGLCVAYCEAQDLDTFNKQPPSTKILDNYNKKKQAGDPDMPCVSPVGCPCWNDAELASIQGVACSGGSDTSKILIIGGATETHEALGDANRNRCSYVDNNLEPDLTRTQSIDANEAASCFAEVEAACALFGL